MDDYETIMITVPNRDAYVDNSTLCPKEVVQEVYKNKIGSHIDCCGIAKKIKDVQITDDFIYIQLE